MQQEMLQLTIIALIFKHYNYKNNYKINLNRISDLDLI
jgi:hypothetical protein